VCATLYNHVDFLFSECINLLGLIRSITFSFSSLDCLFVLYFALVRPRDESIQSLVFENRQVMSQKEIADIFRKYFLSITDSIRVNNNKHVCDDPTTYLRNAFSRPFMNIEWKYTNSHELEKIIKSLKTKEHHKSINFLDLTIN
jgi:hypothetical protein